MSAELEKMDGRSRRAEAARDRRRADVLDTALRVFAAKGFHQTRVSDIIEAAGVARGTFYLYFESKEAIFHELLDGLLAQLRATVVGVDMSAGAPPVEVQLGDTVRRILEAVEANRLVTTVLMREAVGLDAAVDAKLREFYGSLHRFIASALEVGHAAGVVRPLDTEIVAACVLGSVKHIMERVVMMSPEEPLPIARVSRAILDYNLRGVLRSG